jgi:hypothetical protein
VSLQKKTWISEKKEWDIGVGSGLISVTGCRSAVLAGVDLYWENLRVFL